jgi:hypothetical protein
LQSIISPVISTSLYFVVFGAAIGSRIESVEGVSYGAFIVPGLIMLTVMTQGITNAAFGIYFPKFIGSIYEVLSAPVGVVEVVAGYVGAAATKSLIIGVIIMITALFHRHSNRPSHRDDVSPGDDLLCLLAVRLHHRHLGAELRAASAGAAAHHHAAGVSGRQLSTRSPCCRRSGRRSRCSTRWFI